MTIDLRDFFVHFKGEPHQLAAVDMLQRQMPESLLKDDAEWVETFRAAPPIKPDLGRFSPGSSFSYKVTPHITYGELAMNDNARRFTNQKQCEIALELCQFAEKARAAFGNNPVIITSGNRPPAINNAVGGARDSEHLYRPGCGAIDFYLQNVNVYDLQSWCDRAWPYSLGYGAKRGFVHLGVRAGRPRVRWEY